MARVIWKYVWSEQQVAALRAEFSIPAGSEMLHAALQDGQLAMWARVDPAADAVPRRFALAMTGGMAPETEDGEHMGTVLLHDGHFVLHVFAKKETSNG